MEHRIYVNEIIFKGIQLFALHNFITYLRHEAYSYITCSGVAGCANKVV
jgi:hypothetical protein